MGITPPYSTDLAPCDFCFLAKFKGCRYETIELMKEALTKFIDALTQEDFNGAFQKSLERYSKCISTGEDYFEGDLSFMCVLSIKVTIRKRLQTYLMILVYIYMLKRWICSESDGMIEICEKLDKSNISLKLRCVIFRSKVREDKIKPNEISHIKKLSVWFIQLSSYFYHIIT